MKVLITGGMGVNGAVTARLLVRDGLRPVLLDNRADFILMQDIKDQVDCVIGDVCDADFLLRWSRTTRSSASPIWRR